MKQFKTRTWNKLEIVQAKSLGLSVTGLSESGYAKAFEVTGTLAQLRQIGAKWLLPANTPWPADHTAAGLTAAGAILE